ncbi:MAG: twin-arginine translocase TatA/TatE family subunit [Lentisphaerae bacterium]|nr:twin-arginine translocase TatA/TatE family subunit [Lentisphaerota bacterium]
MHVGWQEVVLIVAIIMLLFGAKRLPELARSLGRSMREFRKGREESETADEKKPPNAPAG